MIDKNTIDDIKNRIDIVDVISDFISLKRSGQNYKALSPFTNEKTPSFYVVPSKGIFKDFSSGKGGDAITFVMEHEGMSYPEAIRYLAKKYGVEITEQRNQEELASDNVRDALYILMNYAKDYFKNLLHSNEEGKSIGLAYFKERGFNNRTIDKFDLGYSMEEFDHLTKSFLKKYNVDLLEKSGLTIVKEDRKYDRFHGRVMFPVYNLSGKVIAFGGRLLIKSKDSPKYINSPETELYHKSQVLYGLFQAKNAIRKEDFCYLVEGYTDVISLHQSDVENVVASSGTALTEEQIALIKRFTNNITILYDGDAAGIKATIRGVDLILKGGLNVRIIPLPDGEDPDSLAKKMGSAELKKYLQDRTQDFISFKIGLYMKDMSDPMKKSEAVREIVTSISLIEDRIKRSIYTKETSDILKIPQDILIQELNKISQSNQKTIRQPVKEVQITDPLCVQEREIIRLLLNYVNVVDFILKETDDVEFTNAVFNEILHTYRSNPSVGIAYFMDHGSQLIKQVVADLTIEKNEVSKNWAEKYHIKTQQEDINDVAYKQILRLKFYLIGQMIKNNLNDMKNAGGQDDEKYFGIHEQLKAAEKEIADILGISVVV